jgi:hypothetical protein
MQRLVDLIENFRVYAVCVPCGRMHALDLETLVARHGADATVANVRDRVRCRACGRRSHDIRIVYVGPKDRRVVAEAVVRAAALPAGPRPQPAEGESPAGH